MRCEPTEHRARLLLQRCPWDAIDSAFEQRIPFDEPSENADLLSRMVREGRATRYRLDDKESGERIGSLIVRVEEGSAGRELVAVAAFVCDSARRAQAWSVTSSALLADALDALARAEGCCSIRIHTVRPGMARIACDDHGYRVSEIVLRKTVE